MTFSKIIELLTKLSKKNLRNLAMTAVAAAILMFYIGENERRYSELKGMCWLPIPIAVLAMVAHSKKEDEPVV